MRTGSLKQDVKSVSARLESDRPDHPAGDSVSILRTIFQISPGLLFYLDKDGIILNYLWDNSATFFPKPEKCLGRQIADVLPPNITSRFLGAVTQTMQSGLISSLEYDLEIGTETRSYSTRCIQVHDGNQVIIIRDITVEKRTANSALRHQKLMDALQESAQQLTRELESRAIGVNVTRTCIEQFGVQEAWLGWMGSGRQLEELGYAALNSPEAQPTRQIQPTNEELFYLFERRKPLLTTLPAAVSSSQPTRAMFPLISDDHVQGVLSLFVEIPDFFTPETLDVIQAFNLLASAALKNARLYEDSRRELSQMQTLRFIDQAILSNLDLQSMAAVLLKETAKHIQADALALLVLDTKTQTLDFMDGYGFHYDTLQHSHIKIGESFAGQVAQEKRIIHVRSLQDNPQSFSKAANFSKEGFVMYLGTPLIAHSEVRGVLEIFQRRPFEPDENWLVMLETLANQIAIAIDNTLMVKFLKDSNIVLNSAYDATIEGLSRALELRDRETEGHTRRVAKAAVALARKMGLPEHELGPLNQGALLHDIGKMGIPDAILLKPGALLTEEWITMKQHPLHAYQILSKIDHLKDAMDIPLYHHEKWDGSGYPYGLKGDQIPLVARIFALVDVFDALTSNRPYRNAWSTEQTLRHIQSQADIHFDPEIVPIFTQLLQEEPDLFGSNNPAQPKRLPPNFIY